MTISAGNQRRAGVRGKFIVLEGLDGAGTTTQVKLLGANLRKLGIECETTSEPSPGAVGVLTREILDGLVGVAPHSLAMLFAADRFEHLHNPNSGINRMLDQGVSVVSDRYVLSSLAYQVSQGVDIEWLLELNRFAIVPDLTIFVDTTASECVRRIHARSSKAEMFHSLRDLSLVEKNYRDVLSRDVFMGELVVVDGNLSVGDVAYATCSGTVKAMGFKSGSRSSVKDRGVSGELNVNRAIV